MKILHNPLNGAEIKDVWFEKSLYLSSKANQSFKPGDVVKIEDDKVADFILGIYGFIEAVTMQKAKNLIEAKKNNVFKCDKCDYSTNEENKLKGHKMSHAREAKIDDELGIPIVTGLAKEEKQNLDKNGDIDRQKEIDEQAKEGGLDLGEGLVMEK